MFRTKMKTKAIIQTSILIAPKIAVEIIKDQLLLQPLLPLRDDSQVEIHRQGGNLQKVK